MQGDRQKCLDAGCDGFATKPINRAELIEQIRMLTTDETSFGANQESPAMKSSQPVDQESPFDLAVALGHVAGDEGLLREIAAILLRFDPEWLSEVSLHLRQSDAPAVRRVAHSLKNSAENIGGQPAAAAMLRLENAAIAGCLDEAVTIWPGCRDHFQRLIEAVELFLSKNQSATFNS